MAMSLVQNLLDSSGNYNNLHKVCPRCILLRPEGERV
jgi:hypothetical protein